MSGGVFRVLRNRGLFYVIFLALKGDLVSTIYR